MNKTMGFQQIVSAENGAPVTTHEREVNGADGM
jgi:hypothetical protein